MSAIALAGGLLTWSEGEHPGAGAQGVDSNGLNGNWYKIDRGLFTEHNANGTHKTNVIDKGNLKTTVADGTTIELDATVGLRNKDGGLTGAKCNQTGGQFVDGATLEFNANAIRIKDDGVTPPKISHDNNRTKFCIPFSFATSGTGVYATVGGIVLTANQQIKFGRGGCITGIRLINSAGGFQQSNDGYDAAADNHFTSGQGIAVQITQDLNTITGAVRTFIAGAEATGLLIAPGAAWTAAAVLGLIEIEFDD